MSQKRSLGNDAATIAIVAMAGRFPGASDVGQFWQNLRNGVEDGVERNTRAHLAYEVTDLANWRKRITDKGWKITEQPKIPNYERFHFRDPFGNNIELIQHI